MQKPVLVWSGVFLTAASLAGCGGSDGNSDSQSAPTITSATSIDTPEETRDTSYTAAADDPDGDSVSFSIVGGDDSDKLSIDSSSGELTFNAKPDFENPSDANADKTYRITIEAADGQGGTDTQDVEVTVTDEPEATITSGSQVETQENTTDTGYSATADGSSMKLTFSISGGDDAGEFSIDSSSGDLTFDSAPDFENPSDTGQDNVYRVTIKSSDGQGGSDTQDVKVEVTNVSESSSVEWSSVQPVGKTLRDVVRNSDNAYAVGDGGVVLEHTGSGWSTIINDGPSSNGNNLLGADFTDDGKRLWFVGKSGAIGRYNVVEDTLVDRSAPMDVTDNLQGVAVTGEAGDANVYVATGAGKVPYSFDNGADGTWNSVQPGSGASIRAIDFYGPRSGHSIDGNQTVFDTGDGETWNKLGIADANEGFFGIDSDASDDVRVSAGGGVVYRWDGSSWTSVTIGSVQLNDIEVVSNGIAVGASGKVFLFDGSSWSNSSTPTSENLKAVSFGDPIFAVGANGVIIEGQ